MNPVEALRRDLEAFGAALAELDWDNLVGLSDEVDTEAVYAKFAHLHTSENLARVRTLVEAAPEPRQKRLRFVEDDVLGAVVGNAFREETDRLVTEETRATVVVDGREIPYRSVGVLLREEPDRPRRRRYRDAENRVQARFLPRIEALERRERAFVHELGYPDDATWWERVHGVSLQKLDDMMQAFLRRTDALYERALDARLRDVVGVPLDEAEGHDVAYLMRGKRFDAHFPKEAGVPLLGRFVKRLGFDLHAPNVHLDVADRPTKDDRAFVLPARVPQDVRLCTRPRGGVDDYRSLLHEAGHLLHFAHTDAALPYEDRYMGDDGVTEGYAFLFEHLFENPRFLAEVAPTLAGDELDAYLGWMGLDKLMGLRAYAAMLHYDRFLATHPLEEAREVYVRDMTRWMKVPANPLNYLGTDGFYGTAYLRAWIFEAMHREWLERTFGDRWWHEPAAGDHLRTLYAQGTAPTVEDLAGDLGFGALSLDPVVRDVERLLGA